MSDASLYSVITAVLAVYTITAPLDESGYLVPLKAEVTSGAIS
jgi:hypothetical protein